jgi:putative spermidine/putrescine transport system ATP-binding protein
VELDIAGLPERQHSRQAVNEVRMTLGLEIRDVTKAYGANTVVKNVSLTVPRGQFVCFLGPSGCGKTTLMRMVAGLETPTSGRIFMNDKDITDTPVHRRNFAMVFQALALFPFLSVEDNIAYSMRLRNVGPADRRARVRELLELIKLPDIGNRTIDQLSGGQRQRVAIARALAQEPTLFLLDEPLSALDAKLRDHMQVELRQLQQKLQITTILVTHDQREAMTIADTIVVMADGVVQQIGPPTEIYCNPANRFVAGFIGQSNLLDGVVADDRHIRLGSNLIAADTMPASLRHGDDVTLSIRPESIRVTSRKGADDSNALPGRITFVRDVGGHIELRIDCEGRELIGMAMPAEWAGISTSEAVSVHLPADACTILPG